ncbi:LysR family transcriptional regulator [Halalkalibacter okhensis]|uniref:HTH lysR-type domain-containing protein n=1 Tax=Halalkalibacter okhensis TaxID=333138 RepID=A0A0B0IIR6_9BACI|nr:LysR family transcriptional regulator [Halalkalibacter okhensis]KHF39929.1 hypothetical protein LQ50_12795 [Halalkalibacter okhensis]
MKVDDYNLLVTIKNTGTIRGAAKELLISQPAISQRLKQIEARWGEKIFLRTHKHILVTPVGEKIISFAERVMEGEENLLDAISKMNNDVSGRLSLGVSSVIGQYILPAILEEYIHLYPKVKIELYTGLSPDIRQSISNFHVSITRGEKGNVGKCEELFEDQLFLINKKTVTNAPTEQLLIEFQSEPTFHSMVDEWFYQNPEYKPANIIKVDQIETCKQLMSHGIGMAVLPEIALKDLDLKLYTIHPLVIDDQHLFRPTWLCYTDLASELPQVKAFLNVLKNRYTL